MQYSQQLMTPLSVISGVRPFKAVISFKANTLIGGTRRNTNKPIRRIMTTDKKLLEHSRSNKSVYPKIVKFSRLRQLS